ncbi:Lrp/AsnC family transcriptional regulator [Aestuariispira insulae]|uniref:AsnC family transcriptional regulator n=1 Tax=Aestuariispira insulae TaxID=1461337 RepID=A0A3D9HZN3_9PROT|nr:Lrp/AsnC family transcriptional regulator [Aestuariispira insulae]RED54366.1 AsnC family transcriptional regulator [Aestuariispira insulae]
MSRKVLDPRDLKLLSLLEADARLPISDLARAVNLSPTAVRQRLARLERDGEIAGYTIRRPPLAADNKTTVVMSLRLTGSRCKALFADIGHLTEIRKFWSLAGDVDACLILQVPDMARLQEITEMISDHPVVDRIQSHVVIETHRDE